MTLELKGKIRSTPCPKLILRTVKVPCGPLLMAMTRPSNACRRSLSPSLIFTWTRIWSPGTNVGKSVRLSLSARRCITGCIDIVFSCCWTQNFQFIRELALVRIPAMSGRLQFMAVGGTIKGARQRRRRYEKPHRYLGCYGCLGCRFLGGLHCNYHAKPEIPREHRIGSYSHNLPNCSGQPSRG